MKNRLLRPFLSLLFCVLCILAISAQGEAQSGRRTKQSNPSNSPAPPIEPEPPQQAPAASKPALPEQKLIVGMDELSRSINIPQYMSNAMWEGFLERFRRVSSVLLTVDTRMRRKEATERAKKQTESYVVLLQLDTEYMDTGGVGQASADNLVVNYSIFAPVTGKVKDSGRVYVRSARGILGGTLPTGRTGDSQLYQAGRETADRVMSALHIGGSVIMR